MNPNDAQTQAGFALWLISQGRSDEAVERIRRAQQLDPIDVSGNTVAWIFFQAHHYDEAIRESRSGLAIQPDDANTLLGLGFSLIANNQPADAIPFLEKAVTLSKGSPAATGVLIRAYAHAGRRNDALRLLAELKRRKDAGYVPAGAFVNAYLGLGDNEQAFNWLEQLIKRNQTSCSSSKPTPTSTRSEATPDSRTSSTA